MERALEPWLTITENISIHERFPSINQIHYSTVPQECINVEYSYIGSGFSDVERDDHSCTSVQSFPREIATLSYVSC